jgi:hypothetical protein
MTTAPMANNSTQVQNNKEVNKVYQTSNLSIFKQIDGNRVPNLQHIKRLVDSIRVNGMKCNPILVNERMEVIDGQHRLIAAQEAESFVYYIIVKGYTLSEVHTLNLNQKNWGKKDFMDGYANMGIESYIKLKEFVLKNNDFTFTDCISMCSNSSSSATFTSAQKYRSGRTTAINQKEVFEEGSWIGKDFNLGQEWANKIRMVKTYYSGYNKTIFVGSILALFNNDKFDFNEFLHKLKVQPVTMKDCADRPECKKLIEDIYNYKSRNKVSLRY